VPPLASPRPVRHLTPAALFDRRLHIERRKEAGAGGYDVTTFEGLLKLYYATDGNGKA
jgi:hypothetical protein